MVLPDHVALQGLAVQEQGVAGHFQGVSLIARHDPVVERERAHIDIYGIAFSWDPDRAVRVGAPRLNGAEGEEVPGGLQAQAHGSY